MQMLALSVLNDLYQLATYLEIVFGYCFKTKKDMNINVLLTRQRQRHKIKIVLVTILERIFLLEIQRGHIFKDNIFYFLFFIPKISL
jgi:hypothetical protein